MLGNNVCIDAVVVVDKYIIACQFNMRGGHACICILRYGHLWPFDLGSVWLMFACLSHLSLWHVEGPTVSVIIYDRISQSSLSLCFPPSFVLFLSSFAECSWNYSYWYLYSYYHWEQIVNKRFWIWVTDGDHFFRLNFILIHQNVDDFF